MQKGFTLIEIMIVASIIGVLVVGSVANFSRNNERQRVRQAAETLVTEIRAVQKLADTGVIPPGCIGLLNYYRITSTVNGTSLGVTASCGGNVYTVKSISLQNGTKTSNVVTVDFLPLGGVSPTTLNIGVENANGSFPVTVKVQSGGAVHVD